MQRPCSSHGFVTPPSLDKCIWTATLVSSASRHYKCELIGDLLLSTPRCTFHQTTRMPVQPSLDAYSLLLYQYSHPLLSTYPISVPALHTKQHNSLPSCRAHALCVNTLYDSTVAFGHRPILTMGGSRHDWGFSPRTTGYSIVSTLQYLARVVS